jgi:cobalt-precorrin 5A hydrolase
MECGEMRVAGLGFKRDVTLASLREALVAAGAEGLAAVATVSDKSQTPVLRLLARELNLPIKAIPAAVLAGIETQTQSDLVQARFGVGSVAEAAALAAGARARLVSCRTVSQDRTATAAIAEGDGE